MIKPPHPGETIKEYYLVPLGMSANRLAEVLGIGAARLNEIVRGKRGVTADTICERPNVKVRARIEREVSPLKVA